MNWNSRSWLAIVAVTFCLGLAIGRFAVPTRIEKVPARASSTPRNQASSSLTNANSARDDARAKDAQPSGIESASSGPDVYSPIKDALASGGTTRLYDSFSAFSNLIDDKNVRAVMAFAEKIQKKEQKDALTSLVISRWADFDPKAALEFAQTLPPGNSRNAALNTTLTSWVQHDPAAAIAWTQQMPAGPDRDK